MADLELVRSVASADHYVVIVTPRNKGGMQASVVSGGVTNHPVSGEPVVALVARGRTVKLANLRRNHAATVIFRNGHSWATVEGQADLIGPDDDFPGFARDRVPQLLRDVFTAAGGSHDNWPEYDRVMAEDRRCAVFIHPDRVYGRV